MMVNRPKNIGTAAETKVVRYLIDNGWPNAERRALRGIHDVGDITGTPGLVWEIKGGEAARKASDNQLGLWLGETEIERGHAGEVLGVLVVARAQKNVRDWWALLWADQFIRLCVGGIYSMQPLASRTPVRLPLHQAVTLLRAAGWGDPETEESA